MPPSNKYGNKHHPLGLSREASNVFADPRSSHRDARDSHRMPHGTGEVLTPKHDLSMISGGAPGNAGEEESMNIANNVDWDDMRHSLMDFKTGGPPQPHQ